MFTPLPPERTGVAHYVSMILPKLREIAEVEVIANGERQTATGERIYQLGNNIHHEWIYGEALRVPGIAVLHEVVLHHLISEMTIARGDVEGYVQALRTNHGEAGAAWARGREAGLHTEMGNFLFPASIEIARRSRAVIVHNRYAADRLRSFGVETPIYIVPHPYEPYRAEPGAREEIRARYGFKPADRVIGMFGFLTAAKRADVVLSALNGQKLLVVGERSALPHFDGAIFTGYVDDLDPYYAAVDRVVNLRYPTAGEASGTLMRALAAGKPVAVNDYAQFAELPDDVVVKIPFGAGEVRALADFFTRDLPDPASAQRKWLEENASLEKTVAGYLAACSGGLQASGGLKPAATLPLFPRLETVGVNGRTVTLRNIGDVTLQARSYGEPPYHLIANAKWLDLPRDLAPGETAEVTLEETGRVNLYHGLGSVPMLDPEPFARADIR